MKNYLNESLSAQERAEALVNEMTVEEAASQLRYDAPAVERLGIPAYNWWNEGIHGLARSGVATMFPQAIGLAAMFDTDLVFKVADITSTEARAKYNEYSKRDDRDIYKGLTLWAPNINIFRDPRWGRGHEPKQLIIFDIYENNAYEIEQELKRKYGSKLNLVTLIGSVRDSRRINDVFEKYKPDIVYHAAAHKHVPLMETSPNEAIKNNVVGTYKTAYAALKHGTKRFVLISTDKAVNPTNIMGASKRLCEMVIQSMDAISKAGRTDLLPMLHAHVDEMTDGMLENDPIDEIAVDNIESSEAVKIESVGNKDRNGTQFVAVRFGNVLGSNGSVIPLFKKQIEAGGPVTVTHPDIIRYFMTIPEAVSLVLQAGTYAWGGEIFVLDMGAPVKIDTLARNLIRLSGYKPDVDIKIVYSGLRPGEKLFEEKLMAEEGMMKTDNELIHIGKPIPFDTEMFLGQLGELARASYNNDENIVEMVEKIVPTFSPVGDKPTGNEKYGRNDVAVSAAK